MDYIIKANLVLLLLFLFYQLILKRHTFYNANRWFLLAGLAISVLIPLVTISNYIYYEPVTFHTNANINLLLAETTVSDSPKSFDYIYWLFYVYITGVAAFFIKLLLNIKSLFNLISKSKTEQKKAHKLVLSEQNTAPFSFFNWIVVNPKQFSTKELDLVLQHEIVHVKGFHSIDMMLSQLFAIVFWYNPIAWFYKKELQQNLEFIADQKVHDQSEHQNLYQKLLLKTSIPNQELAFTNTFYNSTIKKRIVMLHKSKSKPVFKLQFLLIIPVLAGFLLSMNTKDVYVPLEIEQSINQANISSKDIKIVFNKDMSDQTLESIKADLNKNDVLMIIKKISRNNEDEIIEIDVDFETENGTANYTVKEPDGIGPFYFEMLADGGSFGVFTLNWDKKTTYRLNESKSFKNSFNLRDTLHISTDSSKSFTTIRQLKSAVKSNDSINDINASLLSTLRASQIIESGNVVYYINNKLSNAGDLKNIQPNNIDNVTVIKDKKELKKLKHADKDGVIHIVLKSQNKYSLTPIGVNKIKSKREYESDPTKSYKSFYAELIKSKLLSNIQFEDIDASLSNLRINYYITKYDTIVITHNGNRISRAEFDKINADDIKSIEVIKDPKKLSKLGYPDKREMIVLKTDALSNHLALKPKNTVTYHKVNSVSYKYYDDKKNSKNSITHHIYKETTDEELKLQIKKFKEFGVTMSYSKLKRNNNGHITNIKVMLKNDDGQEIEDTFSEKNGAVVMEYGLSNGKLKISKLTE